MGVCIDGACGCPEWIITLAIIGGALVYALVGFLVFMIVKSFKDDLEWEYVLLFILLWPLIIAGAVLGAVAYYFGRLIAMPIIGATKDDLKELEDNVDDKMNHLRYEYKPLDVKKVDVAKVKAKPKKAKKKAKK